MKEYINMGEIRGLKGEEKCETTSCKIYIFVIYQPN